MMALISFSMFISRQNQCKHRVGLCHHLFFHSFKRRRAKLVKDLLANSNGKVFLDIGSGLGFLNPLVEKYKGCYVGLEPREDALQFAKDTYNGECFFRGFFPDDLPKNISEQMMQDEGGGGDYFIDHTR